MSNNLILINTIFIIIIHFYIIRSEIKHKKIPNKYLILLFLWNICYFVFNSWNLYIFPIIIKLVILIFFIISLYFLKIWNPSYLKYIFVSSLFFLWVWEITYISNIFFIVFLYIIFYFFYFYLKILFNFKSLKSYISSLSKKTKWDIKNWVIKNKDFLVLKVFTIILWFFSVFILIRIIRYYLQWEFSILDHSFVVNNITINTLALIILALFIITFTLHKLYHKYLLQNYKYLVIIIFFTILFLIYEFTYDYDFISNYLHRILTFLLVLFIVMWIIIKMWRYLFFDNDSKIIHFSKLKPWNIIDKKLIWEYLIWQKSLENNNIAWFIKNIANPISKKDCLELKKYIKKNSEYHKKLWDNLPPNIIRIYNSFYFSPFIFWSFLLTYFIWQNLLVNFVIFIYKNIMWLY